MFNNSAYHLVNRSVFVRIYLITYGRIFGSVGLVLSVVFLPLTAQAAPDLSKLGVTLISGQTDFLKILGSLVDKALILAGILAFLYVLYGGFMYLTSGGDATGANKGKTAITNAIIGIIIIALSYAIVNYVVNTLPK